MPLYRYRCLRCDKQIDILRSFDLSEDLPKEDDPEFTPCEKSEEDGEHKWQKEMGNFRLTRGANWTGKKGYW